MAEQRTFNTAIQGQALIAATNGLDIRALDFTNFLQQLPAMTGGLVYTEADIGGSKLYVNDLVQSSVGHFLVNANADEIESEFYLGPDTADQASNYISLFNLKDTSDVRILDFVKVNSVNRNVYLSTNPPVYTNNHITINKNNTAFSGYGKLFGTTAKAGTHRLVSVQKITDTKVNFDILPGCCNDI